MITRRDAIAGLSLALAAPHIARAERAEFMQAEWAPHQNCVMTWCAADQIYSKSELRQIHLEQAVIAKSITQFEPVLMLVNPGDMDHAKAMCGPDVNYKVMVHTDLWARDTLPTMTRPLKGRMIGTNWNFNVWGEKFEGYDYDRELAGRFSAFRRLQRWDANIVCEGGAIESDGLGTLLTTETCLLNSNRNPGISKDDIEQDLRDFAPAKHVIWLHGSEADTVTDGHIDGLARFMAPGVVVVEITDDTQDPEYHDLQENLARLKSARDARGERLEVIPLQRPDWGNMPERGDDFAASYVNAYFPNGGIVMPRFGDITRDQAARNLFQDLEPDRQIVQIPIDAIAESGGGIHCCTMQIPA